MRIYNLPRCSGKTTRILYISEYTKVPILCMDEITKYELLKRAGALGIEIPRPITLSDLKRGTEFEGNEILVDEALMLLERLINGIATNKTLSVKAITMTDEKMGEVIRTYTEDSHKDVSINEYMSIRMRGKNDGKEV